jgi:hypothetical protein
MIISWIIKDLEKWICLRRILEKALFFAWHVGDGAVATVWKRNGFRVIRLPITLKWLEDLCSMDSVAFFCGGELRLIWI